MRTLEFENTQGINLQYASATVLERILAFVIDLVIIALGGLVLSLIVAAMDASDITVATVWALVVFFYTPLLEIFNDGRSLGKMIVGLKVIRIDGRPVQVYDYLMRWMFRWMDIYATWGALAFLSISATPRSQRIGDMLADTTVINTRQGRVSLNRVLTLSKLQKYTPKYPAAKRLSEEQALYIKSVIDRTRKNKNEAHQEVQDELVQRLKVELEITDKRGGRAFLETIIKDYIALSR